MSHDENKISDQIDGGLKAREEKEMMQENIFMEIHKERERQLEKYGPNDDNHPVVWLAILNKQLGQCSQAALIGFGQPVTDDHKVMYKDKLISIAAVAVAALEQLENE